jgi:ABC-type transporter Mla subunit MlaD
VYDSLAQDVLDDIESAVDDVESRLSAIRAAVEKNAYNWDTDLRQNALVVYDNASRKLLVTAVQELKKIESNTKGGGGSSGSTGTTDTRARRAIADVAEEVHDFADDADTAIEDISRVLGDMQDELDDLGADMGDIDDAMDLLVHSRSGSLRDVGESAEDLRDLEDRLGGYGWDRLGRSARNTRSADGATYNFNINLKGRVDATFERDFRRMIRKLQREGILPKGIAQTT